MWRNSMVSNWSGPEFSTWLSDMRILNQQNSKSGPPSGQKKPSSGKWSSLLLLFTFSLCVHVRTLPSGETEVRNPCCSATLLPRQTQFRPSGVFCGIGCQTFIMLSCSSCLPVSLSAAVSSCFSSNWPLLLPFPSHVVTNHHHWAQERLCSEDTENALKWTLTPNWNGDEQVAALSPTKWRKTEKSGTGKKCRWNITVVKAHA